MKQHQVAACMEAIGITRVLAFNMRLPLWSGKYIPE